MRKIVYILTPAIIGGILLGSLIGRTQPKKSEPAVKAITTTIEPTSVPLRQKSVFIPYWSEPDKNDLDTYNRLLYFGVTATKEGINRDEPGYIKMKTFLQATEGTQAQRWLTIRMTNSESNLAVLNATSSWDHIASEAAALATEHSFDGVVLDLEMSAFSTDGLTKRISDFIVTIHQKLQEAHKPLALAVYGDVFYRKRPYDIKVLSQNSEEIMIMAYDFHKSYGEAGPNFPFNGRERYNYDFRMMVDDFLALVPMDQVTIIYGMYGYDWIVDEKKRPIRPAQSMTLFQVKDKFLDSCEWEHCFVQRDSISEESEVNYIDTSTNYHIVWFEDQVSVDKKSEYMRKRGIGSIAYWAYGYF